MPLLRTIASITFFAMTANAIAAPASRPTAASQASQLTQRIAAIEDTRAVIDALYRFGTGQDLRDADLFRSAWAAQAELDFVQPASRLGVKLTPFRGRANIVQSIMSAVSGLTTSHTVTNPRVTLEGDTAKLFALVEAQHLPKGDHSRNLMLKNFYWRPGARRRHLEDQEDAD
ncbi:nuclear transport factor 2 family protein [Roseateles sp. NT4]|uniref:nuclear transport factor 2 family protein n=1 Tax=Roseateles sp. NT4 TaxID=3453715 RepID=UPI003EEE9DE2